MLEKDMNYDEINSPTRFSNPNSAMDFVNRLVQADESRSKVRAKVKGLLDGNPPYKSSELQKEGQSYRSNVNFRESEGYLAMAISAFYDVLSESSTYATVRVDMADEKAGEWSGIITEEFDKLQKADSDFDYTIQLSQHEMVLFGTGPMFFEDDSSWKCVPLKSNALYVPDGTKSNVNTWEVCAIRTSYNASQLYDFISDEEAAAMAGWKLAEVKRSIMNADPESQTSMNSKSWEYYQQQLRNNDLSYATKVNTVRVAHILFKEKKTGKISHIIVNETNPQDWLYFRKARYDNWQQAIHPMYYDKGDGFHHSVKGMGIKMFGVMEIKNRLKNGIVDSAFLRNMLLLKPGSVESMQNMGIIAKGPYGILPPNSEVIQQSISGVLDAPMAVDRDLDNTLSGNLSQYKQRIDKPGGNPRTATEIDAIMAQQSTLGKTQLNRMYQQADDLHSEKFRRATLDVDPVNEAQRQAKSFMDACKKRGVPKKAFEHCIVRATRVVGQGSQYLRSQTLADLIQMAGMLPEAGRLNLIKDYFAAKVGQAMVSRYIPEGEMSSKEQDQAAMAMIENGIIKDGIAPIVTSTQDHFIHAHTHIQFGGDSVKAIEKDPSVIHDVAALLAGICQHTEQHVQVMMMDPTQKQKATDLEGQLKQLEQITQQVMQQAQAASQDQQQAQAMTSKEQMAQQAFQMDQQRKNASVQADIERKNKKADQTMVLADAKTAAALKRSGVSHQQQVMQKEMSHQMDMSQQVAEAQHQLDQTQPPVAGGSAGA
jgi:hypothetical protein